MAQYWVTDVHPAFVDFLHDYKVLVATHIHQHHDRDAHAVQGFGRHPVTAGTHP
ncbi:hypothetical protein D3C81_2112180 [compost metagenome]